MALLASPPLNAKLGATMTPQLYLFLGALILVATVALMLQHRRSKPVDWELYVAFIRRDFPPQQRDIAQKVAVRLAEIVGLEINRLRPECTLKEIAQWTHDSLSVLEFAMACGEEFGIACDANTTFRAFVERIAVNRQKGT